MAGNSSNDRPLLPYEHGLIEALGVTKQEYLDFICAKQEYIDAKQGTIFDARNEAGTVALVLTIIGTILQVAAALLAPQPEQPRGQGRNTREQRAVPRFGFNGVQEVSRYGEPVGLVYTNTDQNRNGGVRLSTLLLWSAVLSYGGSQFMQLMLSIGASTIEEIKPERTAVGQLPFDQVVRSKAWLYFSDNGPTSYQDFTPIGGIAANAFKEDPTWYGNSANVTTAALSHAKANKKGFSQSYAPTTSNTCSITGIVPINTKAIELKGNGGRDPTDFVPITINGTQGYWEGTKNRPNFPEGGEIVVTILSTTSNKLKGADGREAIESILRNAAAVFDDGSLYKLGGAIFRAKKVAYTDDRRGEIEFSSLKATLVCETSGPMPSIDYDEAWNGKDADQDRVKQLEQISEKEKSIVLLEQQITDINEDLDASFFYDRKQKKELREKRKGLQQKIKTLQTEIDALQEKIDNSPILYSSVLERNGTKCLARIDQAAYSSVTKCEAIELSLKLQLFRQVNGRQRKYGTDEDDYGYKNGENGQQPRTAMFTCEYALDNDQYKTIPYVFCIRGSVQQDIFTYFRFIKLGGGTAEWKIRLTPVTDPEAEAGRRGINFVGYAYVNANSRKRQLNSSNAPGVNNIVIEFNGFVVTPFSAWPPLNKGPKDSMEWELFNYDVRTQTRYSYEQAPELTIAAVNEQLKDKWSDYNASLYRGLSTLAVHAFAGRGFQDLRDVTVWVEKGKKVRALSNNANNYASAAQVDAFVASPKARSSSYAPEIFIDTVLDKDNGIGQYARIESINMPRLAEAQAFCQRNKLFMDGAIIDPQSWREFWAQASAFSLLELATIGGQTTLVPSVPADGNGRILSDRPLPISTLFNQGNILEGSYKEEFVDYGASTQDVIVTAIYRDSESDEYFPRNESVTLRLKSANEALCIRETLDLSQFVTTRNQAVYVARLMCLMRNLSRKAYELQTLPSEASIAPGSYVYIDIGQETWDDLHTGSILTGGELNLPIGGELPEKAGGSLYDFFLYNGKQNTFNKQNVLVRNGIADSLAKYEGYLFAVGRKSSKLSKRSARVIDVEMDEEGIVTVKAVEHPTDNSGISLIAKRIVDASQFVEE